MDSKEYTHWVKINGQIVGKAMVTGEQDGGRQLVFVEVPQFAGIAFFAAINADCLYPMSKIKEPATGP